MYFQQLFNQNMRKTPLSFKIQKFRDSFLTILITTLAI
jgi:hypothetical protein